MATSRDSSTGGSSSSGPGRSSPHSSRGARRGAGRATGPGAGRGATGAGRTPEGTSGDLVPGESPLARAPTAALRKSAAPVPPGPPAARSSGGFGAVPRDHHGKPAFGPVKRFGDFTLIKKLATGGMAEIWLARQTGIAGFARFLVVKKILSHLAEQETFVRMFQDEARTSALLSHPNIVQIHDLGQAEGTYYIAMEYIAGENLAAIAWRGMKRGRPLPTVFAARIIADACKALHYAHNLHGNDGRPLEIVHRDVSPQNILVTYEGEVKVVDFGIAKAATKTEHTKTGMLKGKFSYMSPEQCLGAPVDHRSDIFALGILLYELCTGKRLYKHESELMILDMITKRSVVAPSQVSPNIPPDLEAIILRALEKSVDERFSTALEMQLALETHLRTTSEPAHAAEVSTYMGELFADKIEEKRRLRERASRDDFEALFLDDEATERAAGARRRTVHGASPNQIQVYAGPGATGAYPGAAQPTGPGYAHTPAAFVEEHRTGWGARIITVLALAVIAVAGTVLYAHFTQQPAEIVQTTRFDPGPPAPAQPILTGAISLESSPNQAVIYLDGEPMRLSDGSDAKTPSDLKGLQYGETYTVTIKKDGYQPHVQAIEMSESVDGRTFHPTLEPFPGRLVTEVRGLDAKQVAIAYDGKPVGEGPRVSTEMPGNTTVLVEATLPGKVCDVKPARVRVLPNETVTAQVSCRVARRRRPRPAREPAATSATPPRPEPRKQRLAGAQGCATNPDLPPGFVTIDTKPYSTVFWGERELGETPLSSKRLPAGCVKLRAVAADGSTREVKVEVEPNLTRVYKFEIGG